MGSSRDRVPSATPAPSTVDVVPEQAAAGDQPVDTSTVQRSRRMVIVNALRWLLLVVVIGFAAYQVVRQRQAFGQALHSISVLSLIASLLFVLAGQAAGTVSWQTMLDDLGPPVGLRRASQVFLVGQLGKYVPGSVWAYLLQMELGRRYGIPRARVFTAGLLSVGIAVVTSLGLGLLALPVLITGHRDVLWLYLLLPIGFGCLHPRILSVLAGLVFKVMRKEPLDHQLRKRVVARSALWSLVAYVCFGAHLWLLVNALVDPGFRGLAICVGAMAVALTAGLFAFLLPSGVGVREAVLVAAMVTFLTGPQATAMAVVSRVLFVAADLTMAAVAAGLSGLRAERVRPAGSTRSR